jgi:CysZ protein
MKSIQFHIKAIIEVINQLSKGRFLIYFIPGLVITAIYFWITYRASSIIEATGFLEKIPLIGGYLDQGVDAAFSFIGFLFDQVYIFFIITLLSPFNTYLSEKLDTQLTGQTFEGGFGRIINDLVRMIFIVIIALFMEFFCIGFWLLITWMFGIPDTVFYVVSFLMTAFFFGFSFYDHSLERYEVGVFGSIGFSFQKMLMVTMTGAIFLGLYNFPYQGGTPYIGIFIAPVLTTMISTVVYLHYRGKLPKEVIVENTSDTNE